jgi:hypothetical protein
MAVASFIPIVPSFQKQKWASERVTMYRFLHGMQPPSLYSLWVCLAEVADSTAYYRLSSMVKQH